MLLCEEAIHENEKCYLYLSIASDIICKFGFGFSALWSRFLPNDIWLKEDYMRSIPSSYRMRLCSALSNTHNNESSHKYFVYIMNLVQPFDYIAFTSFIKMNHQTMSNETTERLVSLLVRKNPQSDQLSQIEAVCEFYRCFPDNLALLETLRAWLEANEFQSMRHAYFLDELRIYAKEFGEGKDWIDKKFTNSFRTMLRSGGVAGICFAAKALNHALLNRHYLSDNLYFEWSTGLNSHELSEFDGNSSFAKVINLFRKQAPVDEFELSKTLVEFSKKYADD